MLDFKDLMEWISTFLNFRSPFSSAGPGTITAFLARNFRRGPERSNSHFSKMLSLNFLTQRATTTKTKSTAVVISLMCPSNPLSQGRRSWLTLLLDVQKNQIIIYHIYPLRWCFPVNWASCHGLLSFIQNVLMNLFHILHFWALSSSSDPLIFSLWARI